MDSQGGLTQADGAGHEVTILDVARASGVSASTVSNYLNGRFDRMRSETRERVDQAVRELGYAPNQVARQLKTGHVSMLGLIVASVANPFWGSFAHHVEEAALKYGYQVLLCNGERDPSREKRYAETLWSSGIRGLIFGSSSLTFDHLLNLARKGMRIVTFDRPQQGSDRIALDSIGIDNVLGSSLAISHLIELGHRRIGFITGPLRTVSRLARLEGYRSTLQAAGIKINPDLIWEGVPTSSHFGDIEGTELGYRAATELLSLDDPPTALFAINDMYALGAYAGVRDAGLRIPDDISVVGFDDIALANIVSPSLTTVQQPLATMMEKAVELLVARITGTDPSRPEHIMVAPSLITRASTSCAPQGSRRI